MCNICDNQSLEDLLEHHRGHISQSGFAMHGVGGLARSPGWCHTIGLVELGHPELVMVGSPPLCSPVVHELALSIVDGGQVRLGDQLHLRARDHLVGAVHIAHLLDGMMDAWLEYYDWFGMHPDLEVVQVLTVARGRRTPASSRSLATGADLLGLRE